jgi:hypothetical protein
MPLGVVRQPLQHPAQVVAAGQAPRAVVEEQHQVRPPAESGPPHDLPAGIRERERHQHPPAVRTMNDRPAHLYDL